MNKLQHIDDELIFDFDEFYLKYVTFNSFETLILNLFLKISFKIFFSNAKEDKTREEKSKKYLNPDKETKKCLICSTCGIRYKSAKDFSIEINYYSDKDYKKLYLCKKEICKNSAIHYYPIKLLLK